MIQAAPAIHCSHIHTHALFHLHRPDAAEAGEGGRLTLLGRLVAADGPVVPGTAEDEREEALWVGMCVGVEKGEEEEEESGRHELALCLYAENNTTYTYKRTSSVASEIPFQPRERDSRVLR